MSTLISSHSASPFRAPALLGDNDAMVKGQALQLEVGQRASLSAADLAAYRGYAASLMTDIEQVRSPFEEKTRTMVDGVQTALREIQNHQGGAAAATTGVAPGDSTPRYQPEQHYQEQALAQCKCCANFSNRSPEAQQAILTMVARLLQIQESHAACGPKLEVDGVSAVRMFLQEFVSNPKVTDQMLLKMGSIELKDLARTPEEQRDIEERVPGSRDLISHKMAVALLSAVTGIPPEILSQQCPDLGLSGTPKLGLWEPGTGWTEQMSGEEKEDFQLANILHDTTDFLKDAGIDGLNQAVWGSESGTVSAYDSWMAAYDGDRYAEES